MQVEMHDRCVHCAEHALLCRIWWTICWQNGIICRLQSSPRTWESAWRSSS